MIASKISHRIIALDPDWKSADGCKIGYFHMVPGGADAIRRWQVPHMGLIRIEGTATSTGTGDVGVEAAILVNGKKVWSQHLLKAGQQAACDSRYKVTTGDQVDFVVSQGGGSTTGGSADWDPVVTYVED